VPNVTVRDVTERPETVECGSSILSDAEPEAILRAVEIALQSGADWSPPSEYLEPCVSRTIVNVVLDVPPPTNSCAGKGRPITRGGTDTKCPAASP
jgi:UDP-N-acetylglucosamine 2-epimerase